MNYSFDVEVAKVVGVDCAIMLENFRFWILKNKANNKNFYDGAYWTYNSIKAFSELFPFWTEKQIRRILSNLEKEGYIKSGNYNEVTYDRTKWYSFTEKGEELLNLVNVLTCNSDENYNESVETLCPNGQMNLTERANQFDQKGEPIPDNKPDNKPNNNKKNSYTKEFEECWNYYRDVVGKMGSKKVGFNKFKTCNKKYTMEQIKKAIDKYSKECKGKEEKYIKSATYFFDVDYIETYISKSKVIIQRRDDF